ncbi:MAG TPA: S24 family peptidase, partial [Spirochaetota bacterium]|nr:S24 family peptidase [Spirochaetota bacterium]
LNQTAFAKQYHISINNINDIINNKINPSSQALQKIIKKYNINLNWLLTGEGSMTVGGDKKSVIVKADNINLEIVDDSDDLIEVPILDIKASAGYGIDGEDYPDNKNMLTLRRALLGRYARHKIAAIEIKGNSMEPEYKSGDVVLFQLA